METGPKHEMTGEPVGPASPVDSPVETGRPDSELAPRHYSARPSFASKQRHRLDRVTSGRYS